MQLQIMDFNYKVKEEQQKIEEMVKGEVNGLKEEIEREVTERRVNDQNLIDKFNNDIYF